MAHARMLRTILVVVLAMTMQSQAEQVTESKKTYRDIAAFYSTGEIIWSFNLRSDFGVSCRLDFNIRTESSSTSFTRYEKDDEITLATAGRQRSSPKAHVYHLKATFTNAYTKKGEKYDSMNIRYPDPVNLVSKETIKFQSLNNTCAIFMVKPFKRTRAAIMKKELLELRIRDSANTEEQRNECLEQFQSLVQDTLVDKEKIRTQWTMSPCQAKCAGDASCSSQTQLE